MVTTLTNRSVENISIATHNRASPERQRRQDNNNRDRHYGISNSWNENDNSQPSNSWKQWGGRND